MMAIRHHNQSVKDSMEVTIKCKVTINGKFYGTGPRTIAHCTGIGPDEWIYRARIKDLEGQGHFQKGHFRLRRALWLGKKAPRPSKKRHKGQKKKEKKGSKFKGGGGGDSDTFFFLT